MDDDLHAELRAALKLALEKNNWTQVLLARQVGISSKHLNELLAGTSNGSANMYNRLFAATGYRPRVTIERVKPSGADE